MSIYGYDPETGEQRQTRPFTNPPAEPAVRRARVAVWLPADPAEAARVVDRYMPGNYSVTGADREWVYIEGTDNAGWTLDGYVIPRLASGMIWAKEVHDE